MAATSRIACSAYTNAVGFNIAATCCHYRTCMWAAAMPGYSITDSDNRFAFHKHIARTLYDGAACGICSCVSCYTWHD
jgi:hypothetical protein